MNQRDHQFLQLYQQHRYNDQYRFYENRHKEFGKANTQAIVATIVLMFLTTVTGVVASTSVPFWLKLPCLLLAAIFPVLSTTLAAYGALYAFEQQAKLYQDTIIALSQTQLLSPEMKQGLDETAFIQASSQYIHEVENIFLVEQGQWGQLAKKMRPPT